MTIGLRHPEMLNWTFTVWSCWKSCQLYSTQQQPYWHLYKDDSSCTSKLEEPLYLKRKVGLSICKCSALDLAEDKPTPPGRIWWPQITFSQKSIKEPAKKQFPLNYITQIIPDDTRVRHRRLSATQWQLWQWKLDWERSFPTWLMSYHRWMSLPDNAGITP